MEQDSSYQGEALKNTTAFQGVLSTDNKNKLEVTNRMENIFLFEFFLWKPSPHTPSKVNSDRFRP